MARAGQLGDGELHPIPVLPSRLHLAQSRFVALKDQDEKTLQFAGRLALGRPVDTIW